MEGTLKTNRRGFIGGVSSAAIISASSTAFAQKKYDDGASDTEIRIGHTNPYSGPASAYGVEGQLYQAFFKALNEAGGIGGRKITFITYDDGYSPPKTVEMVRKLVEEDKVLLCFNTLGTPCNTAIHKYMNQKKVPQLFVATGASKWGDPKNFPWTMGFNLSYQSEGQIYAKYLVKTKPNAKIALLYANDDFFAEKENLIKASKPVWKEHEYTDRGKWMDGWESRRRRTSGHDFAIIRLGARGVVRGVVVDTSFFRGNFPESCSIAGVALAPLVSVDELLESKWQPLLT